MTDGWGDYENFRVGGEDGVARVTIDSTSPGNAFNDRMGAELAEIAARLGEDEAVRCIALTSADEVFCAGGDVDGFGGDAAVGFRQGADAHGAIVQFNRTEKPVVTGVNGAAVGLGFGLAIFGDVVVMSEDAYLRYGYPGVGLPGDGSSTFFLPRLVGLRTAKRIAMLDERIGAGEAEEMGLVTVAVPPEEFDGRFRELADRLADGPTRALGRIKRLLNDSYHRPMEEQLFEEIDGIAELAATDDFEEAVGAFREGRDPEFTGR